MRNQTAELCHALGRPHKEMFAGSSKGADMRDISRWIFAFLQFCKCECREKVVLELQ